MTTQKASTKFVYKPVMRCSGGSNCQITGDVAPVQSLGGQSSTSSTSTGFSLGLKLPFGLQNLNLPGIAPYWQNARHNQLVLIL